MEKFKYYGIFAVIIGIFLGLFAWADVFGLHNEIITAIGFIIFFASVCFLITFGCLQGRRLKILGAISSFLLCCCMFCTLCYFGVVPLVPQTESVRQIYGIIALPFLVAGGGSTGARVTIIIFF